MSGEFIIMVCARGPSIVAQGITSVGVYNVTEDKVLRVNVRPFAGQEDNHPQRAELTEDAMPPRDAMQRVHAFLGDKEGVTYTVLGDVSGLHYYLCMAELPTLFQRKAASVTMVTDDKRYWDTKGMLPEQECKAYSLA